MLEWGKAHNHSNIKYGNCPLTGCFSTTVTVAGRFAASSTACLSTTFPDEMIESVAVMRRTYSPNVEVPVITFSMVIVSPRNSRSLRFGRFLLSVGIVLQTMDFL